MNNKFLGTGDDLIPIVPSDTVDLSIPARAIRCRPDGDAGTLRITTGRDEVRDTYIAAGEIIILSVTRVHASGTNATLLEAIV